MNDRFSYTYSAKEQEEIRRIRQKYENPEEGEHSLETLRRLDRSVSAKAGGISLTVGVVGSLLLGGGLSCCMVWPERLFLLGILLGLVGIAVVSLAYPLYDRLLRRGRKKIAPRILSLTDSLLK